MKKLLLAAVLCCGCDLPVQKGYQQVQEALQKMVYAKDPRTGICFAFLASSTYYGYKVTSFTQVDAGACR